jgi:hypothetical protein
MTSTELLGRYLLRAPRRLSFPVGTRDEVLARLCAGGARANISEVNVKPVGELHAVVSPGGPQVFPNFTE